MTIYPHFAALIAELVKTIEGRTWARAYRGPLAIHCATTWGAGGFRACRDWLLSPDCPADLWNALLKASNSSGYPYCEGPEREQPRRAPRSRFALEGDVFQSAFERGHIVAVATLNRIVSPSDLPADVYEHEAPLCDFEYMTHAWVLDDLTRLIAPVVMPTRDGSGRARNFQGLWQVPADVEAQIAARLINQRAAAGGVR